MQFQRNNSFLSSDERNEAEARTMANSFERSISPKFILNKKVSNPSLLTKPKPISLKIEKKVLPVYTFKAQVSHLTFDEQIKTMQVFKKSFRSKELKYAAETAEPKPERGSLPTFAQKTLTRQDGKPSLREPRPEVSIAGNRPPIIASRKGESPLLAKSPFQDSSTNTTKHRESADEDLFSFVSPLLYPNGERRKDDAICNRKVIRKPILKAICSTRTPDVNSRKNSSTSPDKKVTFARRSEVFRL